MVRSVEHTTRRASRNMASNTSLDDALENEWVEGIQNTCHRRRNHREMFTTMSDLRDHWTDQRLITFLRRVHLDGFNVSQIVLIRQHFLRTLSILICIRWNKWAEFAQIFLPIQGREDRSDARIPYTTGELRPILGSFSDSFLFHQPVFCPIELQEGEDIKQNEDWRLPFITDEPKPIGTGAYGNVTKEVIAVGQLRFQSTQGGPSILNTEPFPVARKRFAAQSDFLRELNNLKRLRASLSHHDRIARYIATVTVGLDESAQCNILFPLADSDLEKFLIGLKPQPQSPISLFDMLAETRNLAGALQFLHEQIQLDHGLVRPQHLAPFTVHGHVRCCHMDLKPANILVYLGDGNRPVGKWKITDFGISVLSCPANGPLQSREVTATMRAYATRPPGTYQPPELTGDGGSQVLGRRSDIWSFACILVRILVRAMAGPAGLSRFDDLRKRTDDGTAKHDHDYFYRGSPPSLNLHVRSWIDGVATLDPSHNRAALDQCKDLLLAMFSIDRRNRPTSKQVHSGLGSILNLLTRQHSTPSLPSEDDEGQLQPVVPESPPSSPGSARTSVRYLLQCIDDGDIENIPTQLSLVHNPNELFQGKSALLSAVRAASPDPTALRQLLHHARSLNINLDLEIKGKNGQTALVIAAEAGNVSTIEALLDAGAAIDGRREGSLTPLMNASFHGHTRAVEVFLDRGADPFAVSQNGWNSLHHAAAGKGTAPVITRLCQVIPVDTVSSRGESPLLVAVRRTPDTNPACEWREKFDALWEFRPDLNLPDSNGQTPLAVAVACRRWNWARALLEHRATWTGDIPRNVPNIYIRDLLRSSLTPSRGASDGDIQPRRSSTSIFRTWTNPSLRGPS